MPFPSTLPDPKHRNTNEKSDCCGGSICRCHGCRLLEDGHATGRQRARSFSKPNTRLDLDGRASAGSGTGSPCACCDIVLDSSNQLDTKNVDTTIERNFNRELIRRQLRRHIDCVVGRDLHQEEHQA